jgi:hypothetical protein
MKWKNKMSDNADLKQSACSESQTSNGGVFLRDPIHAPFASPLAKYPAYGGLCCGNDRGARVNPPGLNNMFKSYLNYFLVLLIMIVVDIALLMVLIGIIAFAKGC